MLPGTAVPPAGQCLGQSGSRWVLMVDGLDLGGNDSFLPSLFDASLWRHSFTGAGQGGAWFPGHGPGWPGWIGSWPEGRPLQSAGAAQDDAGRPGFRCPYSHSIEFLNSRSSSQTWHTPRLTEPRAGSIIQWWWQAWPFCTSIPDGLGVSSGVIFFPLGVINKHSRV